MLWIFGSLADVILSHLACRDHLYPKSARTVISIPIDLRVLVGFFGVLVTGRLILMRCFHGSQCHELPRQSVSTDNPLTTSRRTAAWISHRDV